MKRVLGAVMALFWLAGGANAEVGGTFTLERTSGSHWKATYCFDTPVVALAFTRPVDGLRQASWRSATDGLLLGFQDGRAKLQRADSAPFTCGAITFETDTRIPVKNYMAFSTFSDGGVSVFTGYLMGQAYFDDKWHELHLKARYRGFAGDRVITRNPGVLDYQFVYFGPQQVKATPEATLVIDPAIPPVARQGILSALPRANALLKSLFGYAAREQYQVFMAAGELESSKGDHTKGGTQPYQILFTMKGPGSARWAEDDPLYFPQFTVHEVLHIWQEDTWHKQLGNDWQWLHEGGADALSYELMRLSGVYDTMKYTRMWARAEGRCIKGLAGTSVHGAEKDGRFDAVYHCGALVNRMVGEVLNPQSPGDGIVRFWQMMAAWDRETIHFIPSERLYLDTMRRLGFSADAVVSLLTFLGTPTSDPASAIAALRARLVLDKGFVLSGSDAATTD